MTSPSAAAGTASERAASGATARERGASASQTDRAGPRTVREAAFDVMRERGLTTVFSNPGSTEVPFLGGLPDDIRFVLALHEGALVSHGVGVLPDPFGAALDQVRELLDG